MNGLYAMENDILSTEQYKEYYNDKINYVCIQSNTIVYFFALLVNSFAHSHYCHHQANIVQKL